MTSLYVLGSGGGSGRLSFRRKIVLGGPKRPHKFRFSLGRDWVNCFVLFFGRGRSFPQIVSSQEFTRLKSPMSEEP